MTAAKEARAARAGENNQPIRLSAPVDPSPSDST